MRFLLYVYCLIFIGIQTPAISLFLLTSHASLNSRLLVRSLFWTNFPCTNTKMRAYLLPARLQADLAADRKKQEARRLKIADFAYSEPYATSLLRYRPMVPIGAPLPPGPVVW
jgi:hypothetical protein